jgi:hypothetical protein
LAQLRREVAELRAVLHQYRIASLEREREAIIAEVGALQREEAKVRDQVENFDRQIASAPLSPDERSQADGARDQIGGRALREVSGRQSTLAARLGACDQQLHQERRVLAEAIAKQSASPASIVTPR